QMSISERQLYGETIDAAKSAPANVNLSEKERLETQISVLDMALGRLQSQLGGYTYEGSALSPVDSVLKEGKFLAVGPSLFFSTPDGEVVGLVQRRNNVADPVVVEIPDRFNTDLVALINTGTGAFPADPTEDNKAIRIESKRESYFEHIQKGRIVGYVIISLGILAILLGLFKVKEIGGFTTAGRDVVEKTLNLLEEGKQQEALELAQSIKGESGEMLVEGVTHFQEKRGVIEELMFEKILKVRPTLERFLPFLAITAAAAPLLGLLGTVIGMIKTFNLITIFGTGDPTTLASGISEALVTTELGLTVAIPVLILHGMLSRFAKRKLATMEEDAVAFVNGVSTMK
ncbi:MAG: MotA/TolQ/ExbB proton channel family protein, partial [Verrucomicrobiota bacterium]